MKWTCTGLLQACIYMMRPEIITSTFQVVDDASLPPSPEKLPRSPDFPHCEHGYILIQVTQSPTVGFMEGCNSYRCCYMYSGVSSMNICPH